jgi:hypothetical protein
MKKEGFLDRHISLSLTADDLVKAGLHTPSGKLSASALGNPLQWQILKSLAVSKREVDEYTLRKFLRGNHVEDWYLSLLPCVVSKQEFVEYRNVVGYMDAFVDTSAFDFPVGDAPLEIKSVNGMKYKRIKQAGAPDLGHVLQGTLYALAKQTPSFLVSYVCADDYRINTFTLDTADFKEAVDRIIDRYDAQKATGKIPVFEAEEKWQENRKYNDYFDWMGLTQQEIDDRAIAMGLYSP